MTFFLTGLVFATWAARIPARRAELALSNLELATAFTGLNAGAVAGLQFGAVLVTRFGSRRALAFGLPAFAGLLVPLAYAGGLWTLTLALAVSASVNSIVDVAMNDQGVGLQRRYGRSLLSSLHAMHSLGGLAGGGLAVLAASAELTVRTHFVVVTAGSVLLAVLTSRVLLPSVDLHGDADDRASCGSREQLLSGWTGRLLLLGALAFVFTLAEGSALDWGALLLRDGRDASAATAAAAIAVFQGAVSAGRLTGDRLIDRIGPSAVFCLGAMLGGGGLAAGLLLGTVWSALAGLTLLGLGLATLLPISISAAAGVREVPVPLAVARVSTLGYLGSFTGPALIGVLAHTTGLGTALLLSAVAVLTTAFAAPAVGSARPPRR